MENFTQLSYYERCHIYRALCRQKPIRQIAVELGRAPSTISREIARNSDHIGYLYSGEAQERTAKRKHKNMPKVKKDPALKAYIVEHLKIGWSSQTISGARNNKSSGLRISAEAIYQWIYSSEGKGLNLNKFLLRSHKKRGLRRKADKTPRIQIKQLMLLYGG